MFNADSTFNIGAGHIICQDYAIHGMMEHGCYVIGADGCSSSPKSELGARLLCESVRKLIEINGGINGLEQFRSLLLQEMQQLKTQLRLESRNFDATLWFAMMNQSGYLILGWGDGVVRKEYNDGTVEIVKVEFESNAPRYISYALNPDRYRDYLAKFGSEKVVEHYWCRNNDQWRVENERKELEVDGYSYFDSCEIAGGGRVLTNISIMSDGVNTFKQKDADTCLDTVRMADQVCDFVNTKGKFVERQIKWLSTQNQKKGIIHVDDLFCASIHFTPSSISSDEILKALEQEGV